MNRNYLSALAWAGFLACAISLSAPASAAQLTFEVIYTDPPGVGFNDTRAAPPAPGNPGATYGQQRRIAFEHALQEWSGQLFSAVPVRVNVAFQDLGCTGFAAIANEPGRFVGTPNVPFPMTFIGVNLANALAGTRLTGPDFEFDANVRFNLIFDDADACPTPRTFWYGLDPDAATAPIGSQTAFHALALHEIAHSLGFNTWTNVDTGEFSVVNLGGGPVALPSLFDHFLFDLDVDELWVEMTAAQRAASARNQPGLVWSGERVTQAAEEWAVFPPRLQAAPPVGGQSEFPVLVHGFAPYLQTPGITAELVLADPAIACTALANAAEVAGRIVLVDRGGCPFQDKQDVAEAAGAVALILADSIAAGEPNALTLHTQAALSNAASAVPFYSVGLATGNTLKSALPGLIVTLDADLSLDRLGTNEGFVSHHAPAQIAPGSSVIHYAGTLLPHTIMRTGTLNLRFAGGLDLVDDLMADLGWTTLAVETIFADGFE